MELNSSISVCSPSWQYCKLHNEESEEGVSLFRSQNASEEKILLRSYNLYSDKQEYKNVELASQQLSILKEERRLLVCVCVCVLRQGALQWDVNCQ